MTIHGLGIPEDVVEEWKKKYGKVDPDYGIRIDQVVQWLLEQEFKRREASKPGPFKKVIDGLDFDRCTC